MRRLKVAYKGIFRILLDLDTVILFEHRTSMSAKFIARYMDPVVVILRKVIVSFRKRMHMVSGKNILVRTVVDSFLNLL